MATIRLVRKNGQPRTIEPRAFEVLIYLIEHRERVVEKEELFEQVWKQTFVTDSALAQEIKNIRHALVDDAAAPRYIETVRKHGYRFIAEVQEVAPVDAGPSRQIEETVQPAAIGVLPFINMSGDPDNEYFCDGLSEELINRLMKLKGLRVVAHTSSFSFKSKDVDVREIGQKLNAGLILEGSVRRVGDRLRVSLQLINAADGYHVWSEAYDHDWGDLFAIQDEISLAVVDKLKIKLFPDDRKALVKRYTENLQAYHLYLKGRYFWSKRCISGALQKAIEYFQQAIQVDPRYALAYTGLADAYSVLGAYTLKVPKEIFPLAKAMVEKAIETALRAHPGTPHTALVTGAAGEGDLPFVVCNGLGAPGKDDVPACLSFTLPGKGDEHGSRPGKLIVEEMLVFTHADLWIRVGEVAVNFVRGQVPVRHAVLLIRKFCRQIVQWDFARFYGQGGARLIFHWIDN